MELSEFLLARVAEDEAAARAAEPGPWVVGTTTEPIWAPGRGEHWGQTVFTRDGGVNPQKSTVRGSHIASASERPRMVADMARGYLGSLHEPTSDHIARWDPARVLAECEVKRRIVKEHDLAYRTEYEAGLAAALRLLALSYADHPDYRQEWRP